MKFVFLDLNIIMDQCFRRKPDHDPSLEIMRLCQQRKLHAYTSAWCVMTVMYMMGEARDVAGTRIWTKQAVLSYAGSLLSFVSLIETTNRDFATGFSLGWEDWEDALIYAVADLHPKVEAIVTNDRKFINRTKKLKGVKAITPAETLKQLV